MIRRPRQVYRLLIDMIPRLEVAHDDLVRIVALLRNTAGVQVWTGEPPAGAYSAGGWVQHFTGERARLIALRDAGAGPVLNRLFPELVDSAQAYAQDIPQIVGFIQQAIDRHGARNEPLTNGERNQLANAIEGLLEA